MFPHYAKFNRGFTQALNQNMLEDICHDHPEYHAIIFDPIKRNLTYLHILNKLFYQDYVYTYSNKEDGYANTATTIINHLFKIVYNNILTNLSQYNSNNTSKALEELHKALETVSKNAIAIDSIINLDISNDSIWTSGINKAMDALDVAKDLNKECTNYIRGAFYAIERCYEDGRERYDYFVHPQRHGRKFSMLLHILKELKHYQKTVTSEDRELAEIKVVEGVLPDLVTALVLDLAILTARHVHYYGLEDTMKEIIMCRQPWE